MKNRLVIALALLLLFTTYRPQKLPSIKNFNIKEIKIENNFILKDEELKKNLASLLDTNLFFLNNSRIEKILVTENFLESFEIKKIYPNKLKIKIFEKKPIAILHYKKEKFYISENIDLINYIDLEDFKNLPSVFGSKKAFKSLYNNLNVINFPINKIEKFYFYNSKRWDLKTYNNKIIKLPTKNYIESLKNYMNLKEENNFDKYQVFDYRINGQLILK